MLKNSSSSGLNNLACKFYTNFVLNSSSVTLPDLPVRIKSLLCRMNINPTIVSDINFKLDPNKLFRLDGIPAIVLGKRAPEITLQNLQGL